ncbi:MAG: hypothetical protein WBO68_11530 [Pyrinomonadaceae bacterium]
MKIRIRGNTLRFRLGRTEVADLGTNGRIEETVNFGPGDQNNFYYRLERADGDGFAGTFAGGRITVSVPGILIDDWAGSEEVSIEGAQIIDERSQLKFLIEKDFVCLNAHNDEDQCDRYPHPKGGDAC